MDNEKKTEYGGIDAPNAQIVTQGQSGGTNIVNNGLVARHVNHHPDFAKEFIDLIRHLTVDKTLPIEVYYVMGDGEAAQFAQEIVDLLEQNNLPVNKDLGQKAFTKYLTGFNLEKGNHCYELNIFHNTQ